MTPKAIANGNPICWHCMKRLTYRKGGGFKFVLVTDGGGTEHRVHLDCQERAIGHGVKAVLSTTKEPHE